MVFGMVGCVTTPEQRISAIEKAVPLPDDLNIVAPDASIPPEFARFSGKWYGEWDGVMADYRREPTADRRGAHSTATLTRAKEAQ